MEEGVREVREGERDENQNRGAGMQLGASGGFPGMGELVCPRQGQTAGE